MKKSFLAIIVSIVVLFSNCEQDPVETTKVKIIASQTDIAAKTPVTFTFEGDAEFMTFYNGTLKSKFSNYPSDKGTVIDLKNKSLTYTYKEPGAYTATIVAVSYGNNAKKMAFVADSVVINVK